MKKKGEYGEPFSCNTRRTSSREWTVQDRRGGNMCYSNGRNLHFCKRSVECVNAFNGIQEPDEFMEAVRRLRTAYRGMLMMAGPVRELCDLLPEDSNDGE